MLLQYLFAPSIPEDDKAQPFNIGLSLRHLPNRRSASLFQVGNFTVQTTKSAFHRNSFVANAHFA
jgi:hypothetical protein